MVSSTPRPHFTPWKYPVPILQEGGWAPGPVWTENLVPTGIRSRTFLPVVSRYTDCTTGSTRLNCIFSNNLLLNVLWLFSSPRDFYRNLSKGQPVYYLSIESFGFHPIVCFYFLKNVGTYNSDAGESPKGRNASDSLPIGVVSTGAC